MIQLNPKSITIQSMLLAKIMKSVLSLFKHKRYKSRNFHVTWITIVVSFFGLQEIEVIPTPVEIYEMFAGQPAASILIVLLLNFMNPIIKLAQKIGNKTLDFSAVLASQNFWTQISVFAGTGLSMLVGDGKTDLWVALMASIINLFTHIGKDGTKTA